MGRRFGRRPRPRGRRLTPGRSDGGLQAGLVPAFSLQSPGLHWSTLLARRSDHTPEELQSLIVDTAIKLIEETGSVKVTARQIADAIGYAPGTLYTHFANLDEIILHVNARTLVALRGFLLTRLQQQAASNKGALVEMGLAYLEFAQSNPQRFQLMFTPRVAKGEALPGYLQVEIDQLFALLTQQLSAIATADEAELELGASALWSGVHGAASLALADQMFTDMPNVEPEILELLITQFAQAWALRAS